MVTLFLHYLQDALIHQNAKISLWNYQVTYYWDVSPCAENIFEIFLIFILELTSQFLPKSSMTWRVQSPPVLTPPLTFIAHWGYKWQTAQMLLFLLQNYQYYSSAPKGVCASSVTIHTIPAASWCVPCMAVMNRWQTLQQSADFRLWSNNSFHRLSIVGIFWIMIKMF